MERLHQILYYITLHNMRKILKIILVLGFMFMTSFLIYTKVDGQTTYYVKNGGNDAAAGTSPETAWETITKVNSVQSSLTAGSQILFNRGDTFSGTITIGKTGTAANRITYGAYGEGDNPIFNGLETVSGWTSQGDTIYYKTVSAQSRFNYIIIDGKWYAMGRYPNSTFLYYESYSTNVSITDNDLPASPDWTGAEILLKKTDYYVPRCLITDHTDHTLTYTSYGSSRPVEKLGFGYFIQNDLRTLDTFGEWYYDGTTLYVHFGSEDPTSHVVEVPTIDYFIWNYVQSGGSFFNYITIENISFIGAIKSSIYFNRFTDYHIFQNCDFKFNGLSAIQTGDNGMRYCTIQNNTINYSAMAGIWAKAALNLTVKNNTISNSGMLLGADSTGSNMAGVFATGCNNLLVEYNRIDSSGYNGIRFNGNNDTIRNNYITNTLLVFNDGAGIYTDGKLYTGKQISDNIIVNVFGNQEGSPTAKRARGIYLDVSAGNTYISNNTTTECGDYGFFQGGGTLSSYLNNTSFNNSVGSIFFQDYTPYKDGLPVTETTMKYNKFIAKSISEIIIRMGMSDLLILDAFTVSDSNYMMRPISDGLIFRTNVSPNKNLAGWRTLTSQDANSKGWEGVALASDTAVKLYINPTTSDSTFSVVDMRDIDNNRFSGDTTLLAYGSMILINDPDTTKIPPHQAPVFTDSSRLVYVKKFIMYANVGGADTVGTIQERGICWSTEGVPTIDDSKIIVSGGQGAFSATIRTFEPSTTYYVRPYAYNGYGTPGYGNTRTVNVPAFSILMHEGKILKAGTQILTAGGVTGVYNLSVDNETITINSEIYTIDLDYGATDGGEVCDVSSINAAITAAATIGGGFYGDRGTVVIPAGSWYVNDTIMLKSGVSIKIDKNAFFTIAPDYDGAVFYAGEKLINSWVDGGYFYGTTNTWNGIELYSPANASYIYSNWFLNMHFFGVKNTIVFSAATDGWVNANQFQNIYVEAPVSFLKTRKIGESTLGIDGNMFDNIQIQATAVTEFAIDSLTGYHNQFTNIFTWDWSSTGGDPTIVLTDGSAYTYIQGGALTGGSKNNIIDLGFKNVIVSEGSTLTPFSDSLVINGRNNTTNFDLLTVRRDAAAGSRATPAGDAAIRLKSGNEARAGANSSARIVVRNSGNDDYGSHLYFQIHGTVNNATTYTDAMSIHPNKGITYPPLSTGDLVAATGITYAYLARIIYYSGGSAIDISANPQIAAGYPGQVITIIGSSDTNTLTLDDGTGLNLSA